MTQRRAKTYMYFLPTFLKNPTLDRRKEENQNEKKKLLFGDY